MLACDFLRSAGDPTEGTIRRHAQTILIGHSVSSRALLAYFSHP